MTIKTIFNWNFQSTATYTVQPFVTEYLRKEYGDLNEVASDNIDDKDHDDDDDDVNSKYVDVAEISPAEALNILNWLVKLK